MCLIAVADATLSGGLLFGLFSAAITLLYILYFSFTPGRLFSIDADNLPLVLVAATTVLTVVVVGVSGVGPTPWPRRQQPTEV